MSVTNKRQKIKLTIKLDNSKLPPSHLTNLTETTTSNSDDNNEDDEIMMTEAATVTRTTIKSLASPLLPPAEVPSSPISPDRAVQVETPIATNSNGFTSTLPPRKRARTKEEKEQRRVERILRNRRAAHLSREKKKKYIEFLENGIIDLIEGLRQCHDVVNESVQVLQSKTNPGDGKIPSINHLLKDFQRKFTVENGVLNHKTYNEYLEKINQSKNMSLGKTDKKAATPLLGANDNDLLMDDFKNSNPSTPISASNLAAANGHFQSASSLPQSTINGSEGNLPYNMGGILMKQQKLNANVKGLNGCNSKDSIVTQTINTYIKTQKHYLNPSTPKTGASEAGFGLSAGYSYGLDKPQYSDIESDADAAAAMVAIQKQLSRTPLSSSKKSSLNSNNLHSSMNGGTILHHRPIKATFTSSVPSGSTTGLGLGIGIRNNGDVCDKPAQLLNMNPKIELSKMTSTKKDTYSNHQTGATTVAVSDEDEENDAIRIMMSLKNGNSQNK